MQANIDGGVAFHPVHSVEVLKASLEKGLPAAALNGNGGAHWIVIRGYDADTDLFWVRDPQQHPHDPLHQMSPDVAMSLVTCGRQIENEKFVVVVGVESS